MHVENAGFYSIYQRIEDIELGSLLTLVDNDIGLPPVYHWI